MKLHYYKETDSLYIDLSTETSLDSKEVSPGVVVDYSRNGHIVGMDILLVLMIVSAAYAIVDFVAPWNTLEGDFQSVTGQGYQTAGDIGAVSVAVL
jgi:uncharacterized protein YuzE